MAPEGDSRLEYVDGLVLLVFIIVLATLNEQKQKAGICIQPTIQGTSTPQRSIQQTPPKDCANVHNIFRRGLNLLPRVDLEVASLRMLLRLV